MEGDEADTENSFNCDLECPMRMKQITLLVLGGGGESESSSRTEDIGRRLQKEAGRDSNTQIEKKSRELGETTESWHNITMEEENARRP